jgi:hypothetical protein
MIRPRISMTKKRKSEAAVSDILAIITLVILFGLSVMYVRGCERLKGESS